MLASSDSGSLVACRPDVVRSIAPPITKPSNGLLHQSGREGRIMRRTAPLLVLLAAILAAASYCGITVRDDAVVMSVQPGPELEYLP